MRDCGDGRVAHSRRFILKISLKVSCLAMLLISSPLFAATPWEGEWFLIPEKSSLSGHSFTLTKVAGGMWRYDDGSIIYLFKTDGKDYPEPLDPTLLIAARQSNPGTLELTESRSGKTVQRLSKSVSADRSRLVSIRTSVSRAGREHTESAIDIREGVGSGLEGTWRELASSAESPAASAHPATPRQPFWVITSGHADEMTWQIPATGEMLTGKLDGQARPAHGPQVPAGETFSWEAISDKQIEFYYFVNGHLVERATERMSDDGKTWSDTLWAPAYPAEKDVRVFERRT